MIEAYVDGCLRFGQAGVAGIPHGYRAMIAVTKETYTSRRPAAPLGATDMKHQPYTPLPWITDKNAGNIEIVNEKTLFTIATNGAAMKGPARKLAEQNLDYLVHVANAYPKLVEFICGIDGKHASAAKRLLVEIGEMS